MTSDLETAIVITPPDNWLGSQVLVRLPGHVDPATITVANGTTGKLGAVKATRVIERR